MICKNFILFSRIEGVNCIFFHSNTFQTWIHLGSTYSNPTQPSNQTQPKLLSLVSFSFIILVMVWTGFYPHKTLIFCIFLVNLLTHKKCWWRIGWCYFYGILDGAVWEYNLATSVLFLFLLSLLFTKTLASKFGNHLPSFSTKNKLNRSQPDQLINHYTCMYMTYHPTQHSCWNNLQYNERIMHGIDPLA